MKKIRNFIGKFLKAGQKAQSIRSHSIRIGGQDGFTLIEAGIAVVVLSIGIVALIAAARRLTVGSVTTWKRAKMTQIAQARMEEMKAVGYQDYQPNMQLPIVVPTVGVTQVNFAGNTLSVNSVDSLFYDCTTNTYVTQMTDYGVSFAPTPGWTGSDYILAVQSPTPGPGTMWAGKTTTGDACDHTPRDIIFNVLVPNNATGQLSMQFNDADNLGRHQQVQVNGLVRADYPPSTNPIATPGGLTNFSMSVSRYDTTNGKMAVTIHQPSSEVNPNDWGYVLEDGTNQIGLTITCPELIPTGAPTATPTPTPTPLPGPFFQGKTCWNVAINDASIVANSFPVSNAATKYRYPSSTTNSYFYYPFTSGNNGWFSVLATARSNTSAGVTDNSLDVSIYDVTAAATVKGANSNFDVGSASSTIFSNSNFDGSYARWEMNATSLTAVTVTAKGNGTDAAPQWRPGTTIPQWHLISGHNYRLNFASAEAVSFLRVSSFSLFFNQTDTTPTPTPLSTATPTPTIILCTYPLQPTPVSPSGNYSGLTQYVCGLNNKVLASTGKFGYLFKSNWASPILTSVSDGVTTTGISVDHSAKLYADVHLSSGNSVTFRVDFTSGASITLTTSTAGWTTLGPVAISAGRSIQQIFLDFKGTDSTSTNYLGLDAIRIIYDKVYNPNAVLKNIRFSTVSSFRDAIRFAPYVVDSTIEPMDNTASAQGYLVKVTVYSGVNTAAAGATPTWVPDGRFRPVSIVNSVSP